MPADSQRATLQPGHELSQVRVCQTPVGWKQTHPESGGEGKGGNHGIKPTR